jgi:hypothetical protein
MGNSHGDPKAACQARLAHHVSRGVSKRDLGPLAPWLLGFGRAQSDRRCNLGGQVGEGACLWGIMVVLRSPQLSRPRQGGESGERERRSITEEPAAWLEVADSVSARSRFGVQAERQGRQAC